jgi:hypothetical protein
LSSDGGVHQYNHIVVVNSRQAWDGIVRQMSRLHFSDWPLSIVVSFGVWHPLGYCCFIVLWFKLSFNIIGVTLFFCDYTVQYTRTHPYEGTHVNPIPISIFEYWTGNSLRLTKSLHYKHKAVKFWNIRSHRIRCRT